MKSMKILKSQKRVILKLRKIQTAHRGGSVISKIKLSSISKEVLFFKEKYDYTYIWTVRLLLTNSALHDKIHV